MMKYIVLSLTLILTSGALAQGSPMATVIATASAHVIQPLVIAKTSDLAFGNIASGNADGTVIIAVDGSRTSTGGVTLIEAGNVSNAASFDVTGLADATFTIVVPTSIVIAIEGGTDQMTVDNFISSLGTESVLDANGEATLNVGATLNVAAQQTAGIYSGSFDVIVAYY